MDAVRYAASPAMRGSSPYKREISVSRMTEQQHREEIVRFGRMLHERGYVAATDGNLSVRLAPDCILCTPTCMSKGMMAPEDLVTVDMQGRKLSGNRACSSEVAMHLLIYSMRPDVHGIV